MTISYAMLERHARRLARGMQESITASKASIRFVDPD
jgi:hypothetical protein